MWEPFLITYGKTTDGLIAKAHEINPNPPKGELDMLLVTGETAKLLQVIQGEDEVEKMDALISLAVTGGNEEWI